MRIRGSVDTILPPGDQAAEAVWWLRDYGFMPIPYAPDDRRGPRLPCCFRPRYLWPAWSRQKLRIACACVPPFNMHGTIIETLVIDRPANRIVTRHLTRAALARYLAAAPMTAEARRSMPGVASLIDLFLADRERLAGERDD